MKKQRGVYTNFRYRRELLFYYVKTIPSFITILFLLCLVVILFLTLKWGKDSNYQPIGVIILLQISFSTLAAILFHVITNLIPQQRKKLKYFIFIQNSSAYIYKDVSDFFRSIAKPAELENFSNDFYKQTNLRMLCDRVNGTHPVRIIHSIQHFPNPYEAVLFIVDNVESKATRLLGLSDILSVEAMDYLSTILGTCLTLKKSCQITRQKEFEYLSLEICRLYMNVNLLSDIIFRDFPHRLLHHYENKRKELVPESKDFHDVFWKKE